MNPAQIALAGVALNTIMDGGGGAAKSLGDLKTQAIGSSEDLGEAIGTKFAENAAGVKGLLSRTAGKVMNPNLELLFQKPRLRPFSFTFKMSARNADEAKEIIAIIRFFKQNIETLITKLQFFFFYLNDSCTTSFHFFFYLKKNLL